MTILAPTTDQSPADDLRGRLDRLTSATADLTPGNRLLIHSLNMLGDIADQTPGLDLGDWNQTHMHAMTVLENLESDRLAGQPYEAWGNQLKGFLATLSGIIYRALGQDDEPSGGCDSCTCCTATGCGNGLCPTDGLGDSVCPCTSVDRAPEQPTSLLTGFDVMDAAEALRNAAHIDCTTLSARDRQALAYLTYWDATPRVTRILLGWLATQNPKLTMPLRQGLALHLLDTTRLLPDVPEDVQDAWLAARDRETPCVVDQIITALAAYAATRTGEDGYSLLNGAVQTAIRVGKPGVLLDEVPQAASQAIGDVLADLDGEGLVAEPQQSPVGRALKIIAAHAARNPGTPAADTLTWAIAVISAEVAHADPSPIPDSTVFAAHEEADRLVERERAGMLAAEYGETPATATR